MASGFHNIHEGVCRFSDIKSGPQRRLPPIQGFEDRPLVSLEEAAKPLESLVNQVQQMVWTVKDSCSQPKDGLSENESASIMLYTLEWTSLESSFYFILNTALRSEDRKKLVPWFLYLRLVIHALSKLQPSTPRVIYRGVKLDLSSEYCEGKEITWWPFSSCTTSIHVLEKHIGQTGKRTIFNILCPSTIDINQHSYYQTEKEHLLYPARQFKVISVLNAGNDLHIIELEETEPPFPLFKMPPIEKSNSRSTDQFINILLIGEKGVGKSTFINAFVNYLSFKTVQQAQSNRPLVLKPLSFRMMTNDTFQERIITFGGFDHRDQSPTQRCQTYTFNLRQNDGKKLCLIDTPSFEDSHGSDQDNSDNNIKHILDYVNTLTHLNAVCFLLQPDASRLMTSFQSCFGQLINRLGRNARENVIFCFTNALMTFSMPGSTTPLLRNMFTSLSMNDIPFSKENTFFFENESFRYLLAVQNGINFNDQEKAEYMMSWSESVDESNRFLNLILRRPPYRIIKK